MNKCLLLVSCFLLTINFSYAAKVIKVKAKTVLLKDSDASSFKKGSKLRLKDNNGKTRGILKITKIKGPIIVTKLLKGKAQKGWQAKVRSKKAKRSKPEKSSSNANVTNLDYFSGGGGIYASSADSYDKSLIFNLEYAMGFSSAKNWIFSATFIHSTEVLNDTTFSGVEGNFTYKQTTMHFLGQIKYKLTEMLYTNLAGGYFSSNGTMTNIASSESLKLDRSGLIFGVGGGLMFNINSNSFLDLNATLLNYSASSISFNGEEQENISSSDSRITTTASYGIRF